ncbi:MAG: nucleotidyltransferase [Myxococcales bacterium]|nr:MAG: nucleotidyltransferase [Myxococcales bacterium]
MTVRERIRSKRREIDTIAKRYGVTSIRLFGSVARGDDRPESDIDLLIEVEPGRGLLDHAGFTIEMQKLLGVHVDVVTKGGLKDRLRDHVLSEAVSL